jgi:cytochrome c556
MKRIIASAVAASALTIALAWGAATVSAQDKLAEVMDRRDTMKAQSKAIETIKGYIDGKTDQADATKSADDLVKLATSLPTKFPQGTSADDFPGKSGAKPIIWTDWNKFLEGQKTMASLAEKLDAAVKSGDKKATEDGFAAIGKDGCGACHGTYRLKLS